MGRISTEAGYETGRREWSPGAPSYVFSVDIEYGRNQALHSG